MPIKNKSRWYDFVEKNTDPYGACCVMVAKRVMENLDDLPKGEAINASQMICDADEETNAGDITGFMAGAVANMVSICHSRGKAFQKSWNDFHDPHGRAKGEGTVNPAVVIVETTKTKEKHN